MEVDGVPRVDRWDVVIGGLRHYFKHLAKELNISPYTKLPRSPTIAQINEHASTVFGVVPDPWALVPQPASVHEPTPAAPTTAPSSPSTQQPNSSEEPGNQDKDPDVDNAAGHAANDSGKPNGGNKKGPDDAQDSKLVPLEKCEIGNIVDTVVSSTKRPREVDDNGDTEKGETSVAKKGRKF